MPDLIMCQLCFYVFEKDELASAHRDPDFDWEDICVRCSATEWLSIMKQWAV